MRKIKITLLELVLLEFVVSGASAAIFGMFESDLNLTELGVRKKFRK